MKSGGKDVRLKQSVGKRVSNSVILGGITSLAEANGKIIRRSIPKNSQPR